MDWSTFLYTAKQENLAQTYISANARMKALAHFDKSISSKLREISFSAQEI
jgi:hypothetical protein